jgi:hypothetical protein
MVDRIPNHVALRAASRVRDPDTFLQLTVGFHEHHADEVLPRSHEGMLASCQPCDDAVVFRYFADVCQSRR